MWLILPSCARIPLPKPHHVNQAALRNCLKAFPQVPAQLVHALNLEKADDSKQSMHGVLSVSPKRRTFRTTLLSVHGIVLLDAMFTTSRARWVVKPARSNNNDFLAGLRSDLDFWLLVPTQGAIHASVSADNDTLCVWQHSENEKLQLKVNGPEKSEFSIVSKRGKPVRTLSLSQTGFLLVNHRAGYKLRGKLLSSSSLPSGVDVFSTSP